MLDSAIVWEDLMSVNDALLPECDREMANTRKVLERVPEAKLGWKPHPKSMTLGRISRRERRS